jgi:tetratricopeptide (TPR) repeat protein
MDEPRYSTSNEGPIQGQVIGDHPIVHQHFYPTGPISQQPPTPEHAWNIPYRRNPFFTGREQLLTRLHDNLTNNKSAALTQAQAINGLGGIGKTQTALEYAYRYRDEYRFDLWARAATRDTLFADFNALAYLLHLPEKNEQDQNIVVAAVKRWLTNQTQWLLILDNADDLDLVSNFLPTEGNGHILLTTRVQAVGRIAHSIAIEKMDKQEGTLLLLRRAKLLAPDAELATASEIDRIKAEAIVLAVDCLPLAIDQAGAYIEETGCSVFTYLDRYQQRQIALLKRRGSSSIDHPESVATTWSLSFEQVERDNPAAADLLRVCAFLSPDAIPEEMIVEGAVHLGPLMQPIATDPSLLDEAIAALRHFSLLRRNTDSSMLTIHRLVQIVLKDSMNDETQRQWAERTILMVNSAFPDVRYETWVQCQRYLSHAQVCASLILQHSFSFSEAARLLNQAGSYLQGHAQYEQAEPLLKRALAICEQVLGPEHPDTATSLNNLAELYWEQGQYEQAEPLLKRALAIREQVLGPEHPDTATSLNNLGLLYRDKGQYEQAEPLLKRALAIREQVLGPEHPNTASTLNYLARLYRLQGKYTQAEPLLERALAIREQVLGPEHPDTATSLNNLARLYQDQGQYKQAEPLLKRALAIREQVLGEQNPYTATILNNLALVYQDQRQYEQAEPLLKRALAIREQVLGPEHPYTANSLNNLAELYLKQVQAEQAELLLKRALAIQENVLKPEHLDIATSLSNLAWLYRIQGKYTQAEPLLKRALAIREQVLGPEHPKTATLLEKYLDLLQIMKREEEAIKLQARVQDMQNKSVS